MKKSIYYEKDKKEEKKIPFVEIKEKEYNKKYKVYSEYLGNYMLTHDEKYFPYLNSLKIGDTTKYLSHVLSNVSGEFLVVGKGENIFMKKSGIFIERIIPDGYVESRQNPDVLIRFFGKKLTLFTEKGFFHEFPIKGELIKNKNNKFLFFCDEENGKHIFDMEISKRNGRFYSDEEIEENLKNKGDIYVWHHGNIRYRIFPKKLKK